MRHALITLAALPLFALPAFAEGLTGSYTVEGKNPDGSSYFGTAELVENGTAVSLTWTVAGSSFAGAGIVDGKLITVQWGDPNPVYYVITPSGALHGTWADGTALDRLTPMR
ncbi:hypothetical protein [Oceanicola sp. 502str15]|uniref:LIC10280 family protein n=1 Tax=Oceanicola sp. 502str15 TaxID=2696061 RepID=UPI002094E55E|nr:hypothetical protein [Oceanicola sp. 502str15]MCO6383723.1 hypothetical protein [Oceanicola sp. 502str15]